MPGSGITPVKSTGSYRHYNHVSPLELCTTENGETVIIRTAVAGSKR